MDEHKVVLSADVRKLKQGFKDATVTTENFNKVIQNTRKFLHSEWTNGIYGVREIIKSNSNEIAKQNELYVKQAKILSSIKNKKVNEMGIASSGRLFKNEGYSGNMAVFKESTKQATAEVKTLDKSMEDTSRVSSRVGGEISKSFNKGLKSVKRLTIGFLGARSAFSLFRKYMSEYQSQNEDFANKMQLTTNVITNALAPAFEFFGNVIQYAVIGLARIIELLTGVNILGKTVDNSFRGASKSAKEFNDNLSGLDEISNIDQSSASGLSSGIGGQMKALEEFQKKIAEVDAWLEKTGIKKWIQDIGKFMGDLWNGFKNQPEWAKWLEAGIGIAGLLLLKLGTGSGLLGVLAIIAGYSLYQLISQFDKLIDDINKVQSKANEVAEDNEKRGKVTDKVTGEIVNDINEGITSAERMAHQYLVSIF